jgi:hypothetical protein
MYAKVGVIVYRYSPNVFPYSWCYSLGLTLSLSLHLYAAPNLLSLDLIGLV